ncbi:MAG: NTP transferase domain-containing protein, partial [Pseudomonadota bacterium]
HPYCFVCGCDAPFLNARLIRWLIAQADGFDAVIPRTREGLQPLHAVYARSALRGIEEQLRRQRWDLKALAMTLRVNVIAAEALHPFDPGGLSFVNLNTPEAFREAEKHQR